MSAQHPRSDAYLEALDEVLRSDAPECRMVLGAQDAWLLVRTGPTRGRLLVESPSSQYLPEAHRLTPQRAQLMRERGYALEDRGRLFRRQLSTDPAALRQLSTEAFEILEQVYGADVSPDSVRLDILHDRRAHPQNPQLTAAMRKMAEGWDEHQRLALYNQIVNATLLVAVDPQADESMDGGEEYLSLERQPRPVFAAFSDWEALRMWRPRGWEYVPVHGADLVEQALELRAAGIRFNPDGDVGGEIYPHEIETMARGVKIWRRRHLA